MRASMPGRLSLNLGSRRGFRRRSSDHEWHADSSGVGSGALAAATTNKIIRPERVILVRHGESMGNRDEGVYVVTPDWKVPLTDKGLEQSVACGQRIKDPYLRTRQTLGGIISALGHSNDIIGVREEPRLSEQQFGNFQDVAEVQFAKEQRHRFGRFYYRFSDGESGLDVYSRVTSFLSTMYADFANEAIQSRDLNVLVVTHGLTLRLLAMRWFMFTLSDFETSTNPVNGGLFVVERRSDGQGKEWFEPTDSSCSAINFRKQQTRGSLWRLYQDEHEKRGKG